MIEAKLIQVMKDLGAIGKEQRNTNQNYMFRGIDDLYNALSPVLVRHGVIIVPEVLNVDSGTFDTKSSRQQYARLLVKYSFIDVEKSPTEGGYKVEATVYGEGCDTLDKASGKAMSDALKYALLQVLCIPTEEQEDKEFDATPEPPRRRKVKDDDDRDPASTPPSGSNGARTSRRVRT